MIVYNSKNSNGNLNLMALRQKVCVN